MRVKLLFLAITALMIVGLACGQQVVQSSVGSVITPIEEVGNYLGEEVTTCGDVIDARYHIFKKGRPTYLYLNEEFPFHDHLTKRKRKSCFSS